MHYKQPERMFSWNWTFGWYGPENGGTQFWQQTPCLNLFMGEFSSNVYFNLYHFYHRESNHGE